MMNSSSLIVLFSCIFVLLSFLCQQTHSQDNYICPEDCSSRPCPEEENPDCLRYESGLCAECKPGYFSADEGKPCKSCEEVFLSTCSECEDYNGCKADSCECGTEDWSGSCQIKYCKESDECAEQVTLESEEETTSEEEEEETTEEESEENTGTEGPSEEYIIDTDDLITSSAAIATFSTNGIIGYVTVYEGHINISLDFSEFNFEEEFEDINGEECFDGGVRFGIFSQWDHNDMNDKTQDKCSSEYTGRRWDPWLACSSASGNRYCQSSDTSDSCIPNGGAWDISYNPDSDDAEYEYICDPINYQYNPFVCEVGDLSGKYGELLYDKDKKTINTLLSSPYEVDGIDLGGLSIVFRCHDNSRAFCAPFTSYDGVNEETSELTRPWQNISYSSVVSKIAQFGDEGSKSYIYLSWFGKYEIVLNSNDVGVPGNCGTALLYRIFDDETCGDSQAEDEDTHIYDPTVTCNQQSNQFNRGYCDYVGDAAATSEGERCNDKDWEYNCNKDNYQTYGYYRWDCNPGDLSGKYGTIDIETSVNYNISYKGFDDLMVPMGQLQGKSVGIQCNADYSIVNCATFLDYEDDKDYDGEEENKKRNKNKNKNKNKEDTVGGVGVNVWIILLVIGIMAIAPCVKWYKNNKSKSQGPAGISNDDDGFGRVKSAENSRSSKLKQYSRQSMTADGPEVMYEGGNGGYGRTNTFSYGGDTPQTPSHGKNLSIHEKAALARQKRTATQMAGGY